MLVAKSVTTRLEKLEKDAGQGKDDLLIVDGIGKTQEEIDREIARQRAAGNTGPIIVIDR